MELHWLFYFVPMIALLGLGVYAYVSDGKRYAMDQWTRGHYLRLFVISIIPLANLVLLLIVLIVPLFEMDWEPLRRWFNSPPKRFFGKK